MDIERLVQKYAEPKRGVRKLGRAVLAEAANQSVTQAESELGRRHGAVQTTMNMVYAALDLRPGQSGMLILGRDEEGTTYRAEVRLRSEIGIVIFDALDRTTFAVRPLGAELFRGQYSSSDSRLVLSIAEGEVAWKDTGKPLAPARLDIVTKAEANISANEATASMLLEAVTDPVLNRIAAERLEVLQQP